MKVSSIVMIFTLAIVQDSVAQENEKRKVTRVLTDLGQFSVRVGMSGVKPLKQDSVSGATRLSYEGGVSYGIGKRLNIDVDFSTASFDPHFDFDDYVAPFRNKEFITVNKKRTHAQKTNIALGLAYNIPVAVRSSVNLSFHSGVSITRYPDFTVIQTNDNGTTSTVAKYSAPVTMTPGTVMLRPAVGFNHKINRKTGFYVTARYQTDLNSKGFETTYKDLSNVDFTLPDREVQYQIERAPVITTNTSGIKKMISFGAGVTIHFGGKIRGGIEDKGTDVGM